jgi:hypothetical protein
MQIFSVNQIQTPYMIDAQFLAELGSHFVLL